MLIIRYMLTILSNNCIKVTCFVYNLNIIHVSQSSYKTSIIKYCNLIVDMYRLMVSVCDSNSNCTSYVSN